MMLGRRYGDKWQFHIDTDEFLSYTPKKGAFLKPLLAQLEMNHYRNATAAAKSGFISSLQSREVPPLSVIQLRRFNFWGVEETNRKDPVLERLTWRGTQPMWHTEGWVGWHDKLAVNPQQILP